MGKVLLLLIVALAALAYFPESRAVLLDAAGPVVVPVQRWSTGDEMARVGRHVLDYERLTDLLPEGEDWLPWLESRYPSMEDATDPWGSVYHLVVWPDSVGVVSPGPDRVLLTDDDFQVVAVRE